MGTIPTDQIKNVYGSDVIKMTSQELASYNDKADTNEAAAWVDYWMSNAKKVVEPSKEELTKSGRMYLALSRAARERKTRDNR